MTMMALDARSLRAWLTLAQMSFSAHPTAAPAAMQKRALREQPSPFPTPVAPVDANKALNEAHLLLPEPDLQEKLLRLERQMATMQDHLAELAQVLLKEGTWRDASHRHLLERWAHPEGNQETLLSLLHTMSAEPVPEERTRRPLHPAEFQARTRQLSPLIHYQMDSTYVVSDPKEPDLSLVPDSPAWFDWLATLSCFRFVGKCGRFSAFRAGSRRTPSRAWRAQRYTPSRNYRHYLGVTDQLSVAILEQAAALLQSFLE